MRSLVRTVTFVFIALLVTQFIIGGFSFGRNEGQTVFLLIIALSLLTIFMSPAFKLISLPSGGPGYFFLAFLLTAITLYVLTLFIPHFSIVETTLSELIILGVVLPAKHLTIFWSLVFSTLLYVSILSFFDWLCYKK